ncbi:MAG: nucleotidyltransferase domain-containing protein [Actinomycetota bacterium]|nr:nucleotidyltransferase domain-containing protein [Actinomycetota bacterium]
MPVSDRGDKGSGGLPLVAGERRLSLRDWVPSIVEEIVDGFSPRRVILFGSVARGQATEESDVDLMVVFDHLDRARRRELQGRLMASVTVPVPFDIFVMDVAEFDGRRTSMGRSPTGRPGRGWSSMSDPLPDDLADAEPSIGEARTAMPAEATSTLRRCSRPVGRRSSTMVNAR